MKAAESVNSVAHSGHSMADTLLFPTAFLAAFGAAAAGAAADAAAEAAAAAAIVVADGIVDDAVRPVDKSRPLLLDFNFSIPLSRLSLYALPFAKSYILYF